MKHTIKNKSETKIEMIVELGAEDLAEVKQRTLKRMAASVKVAGFRQGKVPAAIAEKHLDPNAVNGQILEDAVNNSATTIFEEADIRPLDQPKVDVKKYVPGQELEYELQVEVLPKVKLGDYKKLKANKPAVEVTDEDIAKVIDSIRKSSSTKNVVDREAKEGDEVLIDFKGTDKDGNSVSGADGESYPLALGSNSFIPGFEEGLVGHKKGDQFDLPLSFPKDYHAKSLAGTKITFAVTVKEVKEVVLPETNDEFAAKVGPFKTMDELEADIRRELTEQKEREAVDKLKDDLIGQLIKGSHIPVSDLLVADQEKSIEQDFNQNLMYRGMTLEQYLERQGITEEEWHEKELRPQAISRVQVGLALAELGKVEEIEVNKHELEESLQELLQRYSNKPEFKAQIDTPEARRDIANRIMTNKTIDRLVELNK
jgi:trigger factor